MHRLRSLVFLITCLAIIASLPACTADQQGDGVAAEQAYVDLLYALQGEDQAASLRAMRAFDGDIRRLRGQWYRPLQGDRLDDVRYHMDLAECAYLDAYESIEDGELDLAMVQLDRAVYELAVGDPASIHELYVGSIYDFVSVWLDMDTQLRGEACDFDWAMVADCGRDVRVTWRQLRGYRPAGYLYYPTPVDEATFTAAHAALDEKTEDFHRVLKTGDRCLLQDTGNEVSEALWNLLLLFGTPEPSPEPSL